MSLQIDTDSGKQYKVLCIEDDETVRNNIQYFLEDEGYEVISADNGLDGIQLFRDLKPDLVLSDLRMPGMNGLEVLETIKQESQNTEVIIISGTGRETDLMQCINKGAFRYFPKPANLVEIGAEVKSAIELSKLRLRDKEYRAKLEDLVSDLRNEIKKHQETEADLLTAKKQAEAANEAKSEFLANISHELRTPMHGILSYSKFGVDKIDTSPKEKQLHYFNQIQKSGTRLLVLLNDLLDLSKLESGQVDQQMQRENILHIVQSIVDECTSTLNEKHITAEVTDHTISNIVICDGFKIGQVIRNLLSNAIKFSPSHQRIAISISDSHISQGRRSTDNDLTPAVLIRVKDNGVGIPENELVTIFDKFIQSSKTKTGAGGTGLGLAICYQIVKMHEGKIWAENNPEGGTIINLALPNSTTGFKNEDHPT